MHVTRTKGKRRDPISHPIPKNKSSQAVQQSRAVGGAMPTMHRMEAGPAKHDVKCLEASATAGN